MVLWMAVMAGASEPIVAMDLQLPDELPRGQQLELDLRDYELVVLAELLDSPCAVEERWGRNPWTLCTYRLTDSALASRAIMVLPVLTDCTVPAEGERYLVRRRRANVGFYERCSGPALPNEWDFSDFVLLETGKPGTPSSTLMPLPL